MYVQIFLIYNINKLQVEGAIMDFWNHHGFALFEEAIEFLETGLLLF